MHMLGRTHRAGSREDVELEQLATGVGGGSQEDYAIADHRILDHCASASHVDLEGDGCRPSYERVVASACFYELLSLRSPGTRETPPPDSTPVPSTRPPRR